MSKVCFFKFLQLQSVQNPLFLSKDVFEYIFTKREAHKMSKVCLFKFLKLQSFQNPSFLSKEVFEYISTKREAHKMSKVCLFKKKVQKTVFGWVISSYKSHLLLSVSTFQNKIVVPTSMMQPLNVSFLLTDAAKHGRWVSYTFLQKPRSFKRFSILEENCGADIINVTFKCKTFVKKGTKTVLGWVILSCKSLLLLSISAF